ncbi:unnamed protein product, partial [Mesorhabditis spiculigera]
MSRRNIELSDGPFQHKRSSLCTGRSRTNSLTSPTRHVHYGTMDDSPPVGTPMPNTSFYHRAHRLVPSHGRQRTVSASSIDVYEDPVTGMDRVASNSSMHTYQRGHRASEPIIDTQPLIRQQSSPAKETISSKFESLDYEVCENELYRKEEFKESYQVGLWRISRNRWIACFFIGIFTALVASAIDILVTISKQIKFDYILKGLILSCDHNLEMGESANCMWTVELVWIIYNCALVGIAAFLVIWISPIAGGSGIPQIKCYLNGVAIPDVVKLKTLIAKAIGVSCAVGGGLCAGKEGPMIHSGGCVAAGISQGRSTTLGLDFGFFKEFRNDRDKRDFVAAGAAAGVSAAFGAPIGGVLFALEEGASFWNQNLTWRLFFTSMISSFTVSSVLAWWYGKAGWLSWTGLANFGVFENKNYNIFEIPFFLAIGVIGGVSGAAFNALNVRIAKFRIKYVHTKRQRFMEALIVAAMSGFFGFLTIFMVDDCQPVGVNPNNTEVMQMWCKKGEYSAVANLFFHNPEEGVKSLFHAPINSFRPWTLLIFATEYFFLTAWTFGVSVPSGIFIPMLLTGAAWGRFIGISLSKIVPGVTGIDPGKYALAGAAAQLGGSVRMTISLTAIIMEATKDITFGLPIMLVLMTTKFVGDLFNEGVYDSLIDMQGIPVLGWHPPKMSRNINAQQVMRKDVVAFERRERVGRIKEVLEVTSHHGFPVVDRIEESMTGPLPDYGVLQGVILRSQLMRILERRAFSIHPDGRTGSAYHLTHEDFVDDTDCKTKSMADLGLTSGEDLMSWVDLSPVLHPHPHRVPLNASLPFIYKLFRGLGLRYLMVVNDENRLRGVITRKDVARYRDHRSKNRYRLRELLISEDN